MRDNENKAFFAIDEDVRFEMTRTDKGFELKSTWFDDVAVMTFKTKEKAYEEILSYVKVTEDEFKKMGEE